MFAADAAFKVRLGRAAAATSQICGLFIYDQGNNKVVSFKNAIPVIYNP
ncbi:MAG: hypothetical protein ACJATW_002431 [Glaciecola sp.]|jgi:hypothetical protein